MLFASPLNLKVWLTCALLLLSACEAKLNEAQKDTRSLREIQASGKLVVLTRNAPTTLYTDREEKQSGPEYDLVEAFAASLGLEIEYKLKNSVQEIIAAVENAEGDLAAAGLTITEQRRQKFLFGPAYQDVTQQVVCRRDNVQPENIEDLVGLNIVVIAGSSYVERLQVLRVQYPELTWQETTTEDTEQLLRAVWQREIDCTVADSNIVDINRRYFPELIAPLNLHESESLGWMMSAERGDLQAAIKSWLESFQKSGELSVLQERYYGFVEVFDYVDTRKFISRIRTRYPKYKHLFQQAAAKYELSEMLLAAQAYQESHWRANARSPTGVRGIMMLTLDTARAMGVKSRLDAKQSIFGGARYMSRLVNNRFAEGVEEPDRTWLALAAYNVGRGHLHDAQTLARDQGLNPFLWNDVKQVLPLLADKRYYRNLKYGYARGFEPVRYVQRIRDYQLILENELRHNER
ncbi:MAG TPA: membrane-bound lytic murein transglycosylase MltF [Gammaproteobacteria bacterium]|nr:membrane-bound lytic murein transglycosylase MltF [Gammaproteobacteria bacterium]